MGRAGINEVPLMIASCCWCERMWPVSFKIKESACSELIRSFVRFLRILLCCVLFMGGLLEAILLVVIGKIWLELVIICWIWLQLV